MRNNWWSNWTNSTSTDCIVIIIIINNLDFKLFLIFSFYFFPRIIIATLIFVVLISTFIQLIHDFIENRKDNNNNYNGNNNYHNNITVVSSKPINIKIKHNIEPYKIEEKREKKGSIIYQLILSFSMINNTIKLTKTTDFRSQKLNCIHGIRVFAIIWILIGHIYLLQFFQVFLSLILINQIKSWILIYQMKRIYLIIKFIKFLIFSFFQFQNFKFG